MKTTELVSTLPSRLIALPRPSQIATPFRARRTITLGEAPLEAIVYSTSLGAHQVLINGVPVDNHVLKPGWTVYEHRVLATQATATSLLQPGVNVIVIEVAGGWYTENFGHLGNKGHRYGDQPSAALVLNLRFANGRSETISTNDQWRVSSDIALRSTSIYDGESFDARYNDAAQLGTDFDDASWDRALERPAEIQCVLQTTPPVRVTGKVSPVEIRPMDNERHLIDFGQNVVGRLRITVSGEPGDIVTLRHAEVLENGELSIRPLRAASATDSYTLRGDAAESWTPAFTFHGFRYAEVSGWPGGVVHQRDIVAEVIGTDLRRTGWFDSSSDLLNCFHENVVWSARGNFLSIPSDCPQRDERLGWTADAQVFAPTATTLFDVKEFFSNWLIDLRSEQQDRNGIVPVVVPDPLHDIETPVAGWGDAATTIPWALFERYGDTRILEDSLESMREWVRAVRSRMSAGIWAGDFQFGDWLDPAAPPDDPGFPITHHDLVATAYAYRSAHILARVEEIVGAADKAVAAQSWADTVRSSFFDAFVSGRGLLLSDSVGAYSIGLGLGLADGNDDVRKVWGARLARLVRKSGYRISTGFLATPLLCDALTDAGYPEMALRVLLQTESPSWLAPVLKGATTVWERWDSLLDDGTVNPGQMTSFNHYALGAVVDFIHRRVAGLAPAAPGYAKILFSPLAPGALTHASSRMDTPHGRAAVEWRVHDRVMTVLLEVPAGVQARFIDPFTGKTTDLEAGRHELEFLMQPTKPAVTRAPLGIDIPLSSLLDDVALYSRVYDRLLEYSPAAAKEFANSAEWIPERSLRSLLLYVPDEVRDSVASSLLEGR